MSVVTSQQLPETIVRKQHMKSISVYIGRHLTTAKNITYNSIYTQNKLQQGPPKVPPSPGDHVFPEWEEQTTAMSCPFSFV